MVAHSWNSSKREAEVEGSKAHKFTWVIPWKGPQLGIPSVSGHTIAIHIPHVRPKLSLFPDIGPWKPELRPDSTHIVAWTNRLIDSLDAVPSHSQRNILPFPVSFSSLSLCVSLLLFRYKLSFHTWHGENNCLFSNLLLGDTFLYPPFLLVPGLLCPLSRTSWLCSQAVSPQPFQQSCWQTERLESHFAK